MIVSVSVLIDTYNHEKYIETAIRSVLQQEELGDTTLEVMCFPEPRHRIPERAAELRQGWQCLALEVEDMDRALGALREEGVEPCWGPMKRPDYARAEIRDPDGNPIELRQWYRR